MKKKFVPILLLLILFMSTTLYTANSNLKFSIKNKILNFLKNNLLVTNLNEVFFNFKDISLPEYKLYEIEIMNKDKIKISKNMNFTIMIRSFFSREDYKILDIPVVYTGFKSKNIRTKLVPNTKVKIILNNHNIRFIDTGTVDKILDSDIIIVKNSFNKLLKCRVISDNVLEVIE